MECVEQRNGGYYVAGTRVSLDSVVWSLRRGESPAKTAENFKALTLEQVRNALIFYHANREMLDEYLVRQDIEYERLYEEARAEDPEFYARLDALREADLART